MRPFVDVVGPGFDDLQPSAPPDLDLLATRARLATAVCTNQRHPARRQDTQQFIHGNVLEFLGHDQIDQVARVRQVLAIKGVHRHIAAQAEVMMVSAGPCDTVCVRVQPLHDETL